MCEIVQKFKTSETSKNTCLFPGQLIDVKKDGWVTNNSSYTMQFRCVHKNSGETDTHVVKPGDTLICESDAVLTLLEVTRDVLKTSR